MRIVQWLNSQLTLAVTFPSFPTRPQDDTAIAYVIRNLSLRSNAGTPTARPQDRTRAPNSPFALPEMEDARMGGNLFQLAHSITSYVGAFSPRSREGSTLMG